jgi:hypothetical protein
MEVASGGRSRECSVDVRRYGHSRPTTRTCWGTPGVDELSNRALTGPPTPARSTRTVQGRDVRRDVHDFLVTRRARITPAQAGLPTFGDKRRVAGLRREEVASLAGSASTTTPGSNAATCAASPTRSSTHSPGHCSSTTPNAPTSTTSPVPPTSVPRVLAAGRGRPRTATGSDKASTVSSPGSRSLPTCATPS